MDTILLFILLGLGSGALIAGISLGVVATYRGSGFINLSTGAIAMLGGYAFWSLTSGKIASLPHAVALPLALIFVLAAATLLEFVVYRPLRNTSPLARMVASLGVLLILQSSMLLAFGVTQQPAPSVLPTRLIHLLGSGITLDRFLLTGIVVAATDRARRGLQVDQVRAGHPGGVGERGRGDAQRGVAGHDLAL